MGRIGCNIGHDEEDAMSDEKHEYTIRIPANVHGWDEHVSVKVMADSHYEATEILGTALTELIAKRVTEKT